MLRELNERDEARFWSKVALPNEQGCMLWLDAPAARGYGRMRIEGRAFYAHRISYALAFGEIPEGLVIDHVKARGCASKLCVAPGHLEAVTQAENVHRGESNAWRLRRGSCANGHPLAGDNLIIDFGARRCRACRNEQSRRRWRERGAA